MGRNRDLKTEHKVIKHNHLLWREMFLDCNGTNNESILNRLTDPRQCECGKLLYGSLFFRLYTNVPGVSEIEAEHAKLHAMAKEILTKNSNKKERKAVIRSSDKFLVLLDSAYKLLEKKAIIRKNIHPIHPKELALN